MRLVWTASAKHDLKDVISYIWSDNPAAARKMRIRIETSTNYLKSQPFAGRPGAVAGTREMIAHPSYRIVYQLAGETVSILSVMHTSRQWPPEPDGER